MNDGPDTRALVEAVRAKAMSEAAAADALLDGVTVSVGGVIPAPTLLVSARPSATGSAAGSALAGAAGEAAGKALAGLGLPPEWAAVVSRQGDAELTVMRERLGLLVEAVDPDVVIALDAEAAEDVAAALGTPPLRFGDPVTIGGRRVLAVDGFEASLADEARKRRVWRQLTALREP
ncbi:MAG: hypothetical protein QMC79_03740 [Anaerosomatales bacterium]|nr:hypothetical protein [Anaerosomatales bacterium]